MPRVLRGVVRGGRIEPVEPLDVADGTEVLVTLPTEGDSDLALWRLASHASLQHAWEPEDDVYDELSKG